MKRDGNLTLAMLTTILKEEKASTVTKIGSMRIIHEAPASTASN
jgi:hypothetical protein